MSWIARATVGRVVVGRPVAPATLEDAVAYCNEFRALVPAVPGGRAVVCADYRRVTVFPPGVADELQRLMTDMNPHVERSAIVVAPENATAALQIGRVIREAHLETRRRFTLTNETIHWLSEVLSPAETAHVRGFLAAG
jgi:hypothetical protein